MFFLVLSSEKNTLNINLSVVNFDQSLKRGCGGESLQGELRLSSENADFIQVVIDRRN